MGEKLSNAEAMQAIREETLRMSEWFEQQAGKSVWAENMCPYMAQHLGTILALTRRHRFKETASV